MATDKNTSSQSLNYAIVVALLLLIGLIVYGNHHRKQVQQSGSPVASLTEEQQGNTSAAVVSIESPDKTLADAVHPPSETVMDLTKTVPGQVSQGATGALDDPKEVRRVIENQSRQLRAESAAQGFRPEDKRALALTEEEIRELEQSRNIIQ